MTSSLKVNQAHAYQGYPYTNHIITNRAQPIDQPTAAVWSNLPRTQLVPDQQPSAPRPFGYTPNNGTTASTSTTTDNKKNFEPDDTPVVYIDLPDQNTSTTVQNGENERWKEASSIGADRVTASTYVNQRTHDRHINSEEPYSRRKPGLLDRQPSIPDTIYIDIPDNETADTSTTSRPGTLKLRKPPPPPTTTTTTTNNNNKNDQEDNPVVYIVLPEEQSSSSTVQRGNERLRDATNSSISGNGANGPHFVEDTIFFDQFKNRRIDVGQSNESSYSGSSNFQAGPTLTPSSQFPYETRLGSVYPHSSPAESLPPLIPITDFPKPPPAYSEVDTTPIASLPRTEVIVPNNQNPIGLASSDRQLVSCPHCNRMVHTLPVYENAWITHIIAIMFFLLFFPLGILTYCTDYFKYRNHYCPNCNKLIGYEIPVLCQGMTYTKPV
ncbi:unnamed protein product [Euphydryas editha]|uniref:LITAF domain-containing protein n=1 Tax=Euphydryas editha TaxID=104508 RepID=A0AAU9T9L9_EUPED|nr:unnamed protein product [Euphydryas editha]